MPWLRWLDCCARCRPRHTPRRLSFERLDARDLLALVIDPGVHFLLPDTADQVVPILVARSAPGMDPPVTGFNLRAQLGDGSGPLAEPVFQAVRFTGGIWDASASSTSGGPIAGAEQFAQASVVFNRAGDSTVAEGLVATLVISTAGVAEGSYELRLAGSEIGADSHFIGLQAAEIPAAITVGRIEVSGRPWQNPSDRFDVNNDGVVTPLDVLIVVNDLNARGPRELPFPPVPPETPPPYLDVSGDRLCQPLDALQVINLLNEQSANVPAPEAEGKSGQVQFMRTDGNSTDDKAEAQMERDSPYCLDFSSTVLRLCHPC